MAVFSSNTSGIATFLQDDFRHKLLRLGGNLQCDEVVLLKGLGTNKSPECRAGMTHIESNPSLSADIQLKKDGTLVSANIICCEAQDMGFKQVVKINKFEVHIGDEDIGEDYWDFTDPDTGLDGTLDFPDYFAKYDDDPDILYRWSAIRDPNYVAPGRETSFSDPSSFNNDDNGEDDTEEPADLSAYITLLDAEIESMLNTNTRSMKYIGYASRFFGAPYRFINSTDPPITFSDADEKEFTDGRTYTKNIAMEAPLVHFIPGLPTYISEFNDAEKEVMDNYITAKSEGADISSDIVKRVSEIEGRFFNFVAAYSEYIKYVNTLCRTCAIYMGIGDKNVPGTDTKYKYYNYGNWQDSIRTNEGTSYMDMISGEYDEDGENALANSLVDGGSILKTIGNVAESVAKDILGGNRSVKMYVDAGSSFSESASNTTGQSQIASIFDSGESMMKEIGFWAGGGNLSSTVQSATSSLVEAVGSLGETILGDIGMGGTNLVNLTDYANYIISGSNVVFPEMWQDASYGKSYNFTVNLVAPYGDSETIFLSEIMPLMFILGMALPRQTSANSFTSPMLVRVVSKGWFSCDMGIIDSISIEKGGTDAWNASGLPLSMKVNIGVKDLYSSLSIAKSTQPGLLFNNNALLEFLAATCGVDTIVPNLALKIQTILNAVTTTITDLPTNVYNRRIEALNNTIMQYTKLF